jgi:hypothetical protein
LTERSDEEIREVASSGKFSPNETQGGNGQDQMRQSQQRQQHAA